MRAARHVKSFSIIEHETAAGLSITVGDLLVSVAVGFADLVATDMQEYGHVRRKGSTDRCRRARLSRDNRSTSDGSGWDV